MKVKVLKDTQGNVFTPKVSADSVYLSGSSTTLTNKLSSVDTTLSGKADSFTVSSSTPTASWGGTVTVGTVKGTDLKFKMPANPNTDTTYSAGTDLGLSGTTFNHANSGVTAGTYRSVTVNARGHVTAGSNPTTLSGYGITDAKIASGVITLGSNTITPLTADSTLAAGKVNGTLATSNIPNLDASKITTGTISVDRLPATALERCVVVADDTARFKLTTSSVQVGDTVKVTATKKMYMVIDSSKLSSEAGYEEYFTSTDWSTITNKPSSYTPSSHTHTKSQITDFPSSMPASDVYAWAKASTKPSYAWSEINSKPSSFTPASHTHGNITNAGAIGNAADKLVATTTNGVLTAATTLAATSLAAGSTPTVSLSSGTLTFGIPKGEKGATGATGATGPKGDTGATGATPTIKAASGSNIGTVGTPSVSASTSGTTTTFTFDYLKGAKGDKGDKGATGSQGPKGDTGATGPQGVSVSKVEQTTTSTADAGTNVITVTLSNGTTSTFNVKNGSKGSTGSTGAAAGFGTPTASVDANVGTPSVTVTASGADTAKVFNFAFKNLKGQKGDKGDTGPQGPDGILGLPSFSTSESGKVLTVNSSGNLAWGVCASYSDSLGTIADFAS